MEGIDSRLESKLGFDRMRAAVADYCSTDYALGRTERETVSYDRTEIRHRLQLTDEMRLILMFEESFPTSGYIDALEFLSPLEKAGSQITVPNLAKLGTVVDTVRRVLAFFAGVKKEVYPNLLKMSSGVRNYPEVQRRIESIIDRHGEIKDSASPELQSIRREIRDKEAALGKRAAAILREAQQNGIADADASVTIRDGKYLIPVASSGKRKLQGYVCDVSATGKTSFVEPAEIVELGNAISELQFAEEREIARILYEFTEFLRPYVPDLKNSAAYLGEMDFIMAKARVALSSVAGMPVISDEGALNLRKARHPLLEKALKRDGREMVPLTITLTPRKRILLISGPNAGGKSVCLKTTGLLQYMFQWGMLIPTSETSELPVFDHFAVSLGDDQNLENDLSTYSSFLADMRDMLKVADSKTLVLIDEFGSGTEPSAGGAIAEAILSELDRRGVYAVITTHYTNLKLYASRENTSVINGAMLYDSSRIEPLFRLETGLPGNSFAFELARKMHLPEEIVKDAEARVGEEFVGIEKNLRRIARNRRALDEKLQKIKHTDKALETVTEQYRKELEDIKRERKEILDEARLAAQDIVKGAGAQVEKTIRDIREAEAGKEKTKAARQELQGFLGALEQRGIRNEKARDRYLDKKIESLEKRRGASPPPVAKERQEPFKIGEKARIKGSEMVGEVVKVKPTSVTLTVGNVTSTMSPDRLERISSNEFREISRKVFSQPLQKRDPAVTERRLNFKSEIDIRGERLNDALEIVMHYIDDAVMLGVGTVRIIHGKGTGVLREEIQKYLRTVPGVSVRDEDVRAGGTGVSIVEIQ